MSDDVGDAPLLAEIVDRGFDVGPVVAPQATAHWMPLEELEDLIRHGDLSWSPRGGGIWLGRSPTPAALPAAWRDDRHMVTIAASRAGKGTSAIVPVLCDYPGSVIVLDPKGENASLTSARRGHGCDDPLIEGIHQNVFVLDPFDQSKADDVFDATFNPMAEMRDGDERSRETARLIADALIVSSDQKDAHWDESAKTFVEALILHVATYERHSGDRTLGRVHDLLRDGDRVELQRYRDAVREEILGSLEREPAVSTEDSDAVRRARAERHDARELLKRDAAGRSAFDVLLETMEDNAAFGGAVSGAAMGLNSLGDRERGSILSTARRNLKFLDSPRMQDSLRDSGHMLALSDLKRDEAGVSVYLVLPSRYMRTHARWMRMILNLTIAAMEADPDEPATGHRVLAVLDEFNTLGHMEVLETAAGYMAGFGLTLWTILQDLSQLKRHYPQTWETFLGNAGVVQMFANADQTTVEYASKRIGDTEILIETTSTAITRTSTEEDPTASQLADDAGGMLGLKGAARRTSESEAQAETRNVALTKTALITPTEITEIFSRESGLQLILMPGKPPKILKRCPYHEEPEFKLKVIDDRRNDKISKPTTARR
ncbi:MAG: type IV secretory system conjugative DNA transfer family protein [Pseudomonadota bacterium]